MLRCNAGPRSFVPALTGVLHPSFPQFGVPAGRIVPDKPPKVTFRPEGRSACRFTEVVSELSTEA